MCVDDDDVGSSTRASAAISSTLPLPISVAGTGRASGAIWLAMTLRPMARGQPNRFGEPGFGIAIECGLARLRLDMKHEGGARVCVGRLGGQAVSATVSASMSWIGPIGMTVEIACL